MLTEITTKIAETLATKVRVMTVRQLAEHFYGEKKDPVACAQRAARKLQREGWATTWPAAVRHLNIDRPLLCWNPGGGIPEFGKLAWRNERRWRNEVPRPSLCLTSTNKAKAHFAGHCRTSRRRELEHDINIAQLYLALCRTEPQVAATWLHEDALSHTHSARPDAIIERHSQTVVLDLVGSSYHREKLRDIWNHHRLKQLELW